MCPLALAVLLDGRVVGLRPMSPAPSWVSAAGSTACPSWFWHGRSSPRPSPSRELGRQTAGWARARADRRRRGRGSRGRRRWCRPSAAPARKSPSERSTGSQYSSPPHEVTAPSGGSRGRSRRAGARWTRRTPSVAPAISRQRCGVAGLLAQLACGGRRQGPHPGRRCRRAGRRGPGPGPGRNCRASTTWSSVVRASTRDGGERRHVDVPVGDRAVGHPVGARAHRQPAAGARAFGEQLPGLGPPGRVCGTGSRRRRRRARAGRLVRAAGEGRRRRRVALVRATPPAAPARRPGPRGAFLAEQPVQQRRR